jgi:hypothetical protein
MAQKKTHATEAQIDTKEEPQGAAEEPQQEAINSYTMSSTVIAMVDDLVYQKVKIKAH